MELKLTKQSALKLTLKGSVGSFKVSGKTSDYSSLEVKFFLTHVSLDFDTGSTSDILDYLAPVREIYEAETLEFDEIMQRDLDDARVSSELIPYLLDPSNRDLVKIFPPIVVVILPTEPGSERPADRYPKVESVPAHKPSGMEHHIEILRSGEIGSEVFEFQNPVLDGRSVEHDFAMLKINPQRVKLVIVDGQHRAMALLALYRNLRKEWSTNNRRTPYKDYYAEWTEDYIKQFRLDKLSMPVMFCAFPDLDVESDLEYDLKKASRAVFLALNKNAKKVSDSRNRLLDDNDIVALFLRAVLSEVKSEQQSHLRIWNVELDQAHDKMKIDSPIAITGVNHVYYMIEHCLLSNASHDICGLRPRRGNYSTRVKLDSVGALDRLGARNKLGADVADTITRTSFTAEVGSSLSAQFMQRHGSLIKRVFCEFEPFIWHASTSLKLQKDLETNKPRIKSILFDGQGIFSVFQQHRKGLKERVKEGAFNNNKAELASLIDRLDSENQSIDESIAKLRILRFHEFFGRVTDRFKISQAQEGEVRLEGFVNRLYSNVLTTVAFQTALIATFIGLLEEVYGLDFWDRNDQLTEQEFSNYLRRIEGLFCPNSVAEAKKLVEVFEGSIQIDSDNNLMSLVPTNHTFRSVVYQEEMRPDQWTKYRYLLLELWEPINSDLLVSRDAEVERCRRQVLQALAQKCRDSYLRRHQKIEQQLTQQEHSVIQKESIELYRRLLINLGVRVSALDASYFKKLLTFSLDDIGDDPFLDETD